MSEDQVIGICPICRRNVYFMESHYVDSGTDFHESCYVKHLCVLKKKLDNKKQKGSITLDEATELDGTNQILIRVTTSETNPTKFSKERKYDKLVCKPETRDDFLRSNLNNKMKCLETERSQRWGFEALNAFDTQFYISAPEEKKQLYRGHNDATM